MNAKQLGWLMAIVATIAFSTNTPIARSAVLAGMEPLTLVAGRFLLGSFLFGTTLGLTNIGKATGEERPLDQRGLLIMIASGMVNGLTLLIFFTALKFISASIQSVLSIALIPVSTLLILRLRGEPLTVRHGLRIGLSVIGIWLLFGFQGEVNGWGVILMLIGCVMYAVHLVSVQWYLRPYNTWTVTTVLVVSATMIAVALWFANDQPSFVPGWVGWLAIGVQGIVATYFGRVLTYAAINRIGSGQFALLAPLETALVVIWSVLFLGEQLVGMQRIGTGLILLSALLAAGVQREKKPQLKD